MSYFRNSLWSRVCVSRSKIRPNGFWQKQELHVSLVFDTSIRLIQLTRMLFMQIVCLKRLNKKPNEHPNLVRTYRIGYHPSFKHFQQDPAGIFLAGFYQKDVGCRKLLSRLCFWKFSGSFGTSVQVATFYLNEVTRILTALNAFLGNLMKFDSSPSFSFYHLLLQTFATPSDENIIKHLGR